MFNISNLPSTSSVFSIYTTFSASAMLVRTVVSEIQSIASQVIPEKLQEKIMDSLGGFFRSSASNLTLIIEEYDGYEMNEIYQASETYLSTRITPSIDQIMVKKGSNDKNLKVTIYKGQKITDEFQGIQLVWEFVSRSERRNGSTSDDGSETSEHKSVQLCFNKQHKEKVLNIYLPFVLEKSKAIKDESKAIELYSIFGGDYYWTPINLDHPSTFDTIAIDPALKQDLMDDLERFLKGKEFYRRIGKSWKRGYLLYGPPGTGKSSLIAAMANYLKFNIYDLELTSVRYNSDLKRFLTSMENKSILVIEDIDCSIELQDRRKEEHFSGDSEVTLSGLLNFIDGLWSSCGDERIIVFTTNYKDRIDPALLRPGRMDMHIHMSYITFSGFKIMANNYLKIEDHPLFREIEKLIEEIEVTPAQIAEELMKGDDANIVLKGLQEFLQTKKEMPMQVKNDKEITVNESKKDKSGKWWRKLIRRKTRREGEGKENL